MAELADAHGLGPCAREGVQAQVLFPAPTSPRADTVGCPTRACTCGILHPYPGIFIPRQADAGLGHPRVEKSRLPEPPAHQALRSSPAAPPGANECSPARQCRGSGVIRNPVPPGTADRITRTSVALRAPHRRPAAGPAIPLRMLASYGAPAGFGYTKSSSRPATRRS